MTKKYLVTGGTGFIGEASVRRLVREGHTVRVLDNNSRGKATRLDNVKKDIELYEGDARDASVVTRASKGVDSILHLAAVNGTENFYHSPELVLDVGVRSMLAMLDACRANKIGELVVASSSEAYQTPPTVPTDEQVPLTVPDVRNPRYSYGGSKIISELLAINYGRKDFDRVLIFRPHNVYGPDMGWEHVLPQFILRAVDTIAKTPTGPIPFPMQGDGSQTRSFIHIDDFVTGLTTILNKGEHLNIYNIGTMDELSIADVAKRVVRHFKRDVDLQTGPEPAGATPRRCPDIAKIRKLGFEPKISFDEGLPSIANWYAEHRDQRPRRPSAVASAPSTPALRDTK